jgi:hypothetical protein
LLHFARRLFSGVFTGDVCGGTVYTTVAISQHLFSKGLNSHVVSLGFLHGTCTALEERLIHTASGNEKQGRSKIKIYAFLL